MQLDEVFKNGILRRFKALNYHKGVKLLSKVCFVDKRLLKFTSIRSAKPFTNFKFRFYKL